MNEADRHAFITPDLWSPNSNDVNPVNYTWGIIQQRVILFKWFNRTFKKSSSGTWENSKSKYALKYLNTTFCVKYLNNFRT